jgi:hypothetical protein
MKTTKYLLFLAVILFYGCTGSNESLDLIFSSRYESKIISNGDNIPDFSRNKDSIQLFVTALHENITIKDFQKRAGWSDEKLEEKINFLKQKNWLHTIDETIKPSVFVATDEDSRELKKYAAPIAETIADSIEKIIPYIKESYDEKGFAKKYKFQNISFLILSNVLLDNWQIRYMEKAYLKKEKRPERHGKFYYASINENRIFPKESFGIYGNQTGRDFNGMYINIYGNNRNIANLRLKNDSCFRDSVFTHSPVITQELNSLFENFASVFHPTLIKILNNNSEYAGKIYRKTGYSKEISFEEFFIWWYHFIYTETTNILAERGRLKIPEEGNFYYLFPVNE